MVRGVRGREAEALQTVIEPANAALLAAYAPPTRSPCFSGATLKGKACAGLPKDWLS